MRTVIFDFDGTLADSFDTITSITHRLTGREQLADIEYIKSMRDKGVGLRQALRGLEIPHWQLPWLVRRGRKMMRHEIHRIPIFDGMTEALAKLKDEHYQLFIITSNSRANVHHFLEDKGISKCFKKVYGGVALLDKSKVLKKVLKDNRIKPESTIYVGDEVRDIEAAQRFQMPIVAVSWGYNSEGLLASHSPTRLLNSPNQLPAVIDELNRSLSK